MLEEILHEKSLSVLAELQVFLNALTEANKETPQAVEKNLEKIMAYVSQLPNTDKEMLLTLFIVNGVTSAI